MSILLVVASLALQGCTGDGDEARSDKATPSAQPTSSETDLEQSPSPAPGQLGSDECLLTNSDLELVVRDWTRVQDTVGREDQARYISGLTRRLDSLSEEASECDGASEYRAFAGDVLRLEKLASGSPDYDLYSSAQQAGNQWLDAAGLGANALFRG